MLNYSERTLDTLIKQYILEFYKAFDQTEFIGTINDNRTRYDERSALRSNLYKEEFDELLDGIKKQDVRAILDAIVDMFYIGIGNELEGMNFYFFKKIEHDIERTLGKREYRTFYKPQLMAAFLKVHQSNMSKLGPDGKAVYITEGAKAGKITKGPNYKAPNLSWNVEKIISLKLMEENNDKNI